MNTLNQKVNRFLTDIFFVILIILNLIILNACGTVKVPITVKHPAEINMVKYRQIAIAKITGKHGRDFSSEIKNRLVESGSFKVVNRSRLDTIMKELNLSNSDLASSTNRAKLGKMLSASAMITGYLDGKYKETTDRSKGTCYKKSADGKSIKYACTTYSRKGEYNTSGSIDVIDVETGEILRSKALKASHTGSTSKTGARAPAIDRDALYSRCLQDNVNKLIKSIASWEETVQVPFETDSDIPELERGINQAKMGDLEQAIKIFAKAAKAAETNGEIDGDTIAIAYWNLGLAYQYSWQLDKAIKAFRKAYALDSEDRYIKAKKHAEEMKSEKRKLDEQSKPPNA